MKWAHSGRVHAPHAEDLGKVGGQGDVGTGINIRVRPKTRGGGNDGGREDGTADGTCAWVCAHGMLPVLGVVLSAWRLCTLLDRPWGVRGCVAREWWGGGGRGGGREIVDYH